MSSFNATLRVALEAIVGAERVLTDPDSLERYGSDWTRVYQPAPCAIVLPGSIAEVQDIVRLAASERLPLVPSGGRTGLSAGAVAHRGELVLALDRLNSIDDFNAVVLRLDVRVHLPDVVVDHPLREPAEHVLGVIPRRQYARHRPARAAVPTPLSPGI